LPQNNTYIHKRTQNAQCSQAQLESEAQAVAQYIAVIQMSFRVTDVVSYESKTEVLRSCFSNFLL